MIALRAHFRGFFDQTHKLRVAQFRKSVRAELGKLPLSHGRQRGTREADVDFKRKCEDQCEDLVSSMEELAAQAVGVAASHCRDKRSRQDPRGSPEPVAKFFEAFFACLRGDEHEATLAVGAVHEVHALVRECSLEFSLERADLEESTAKVAASVCAFREAYTQAAGAMRGRARQGYRRALVDGVLSQKAVSLTWLNVAAAALAAAATVSAATAGKSVVQGGGLRLLASVPSASRASNFAIGKAVGAIKAGRPIAQRGLHLLAGASSASSFAIGKAAEAMKAGKPVAQGGFRLLSGVSSASSFAIGKAAAAVSGLMTVFDGVARASTAVHIASDVTSILKSTGLFDALGFSGTDAPTKTANKKKARAAAAGGYADGDAPMLLGHPSAAGGGGRKHSSSDGAFPKLTGSSAAGLLQNRDASEKELDDGGAGESAHEDEEEPSDESRSITSLVSSDSSSALLLGTHPEGREEQRSLPAQT